MSLLFMDGFDHYATADILKKWTTYASSYVSISSAAGRRSGGAIYNSGSNGYFSKTLSATYTTLIVGLAFRPTSISSIGLIFTMREGTTRHTALRINASGKLEFYRGTTILATSNTTLSANTWYYLETKVAISSTVGTTELKINGVTDSGMTLTGANTRNGGTGVIDNLFFGILSTDAASIMYVDDLYICDTSGTANNDFLGDCRIDTLYPTGSGNYTQFTASTGSNYACVDETTPNTTDYVSSATSGNRDSYVFADLSAISSDTIYGVQVNAYAQKSDTGTRSLGTMARSSSTDADGASVALAATSYNYISQIYEKDPSNNAWTQSSVNAAEFGVKVTA